MLEADPFAELLESGQAKAASVGAGEWDEDVFAGMKTALESAWDPDVPKIMILIGDASGHPIGDPKNSMNLDERSVKDLAKEKSVYVASIYVSGKQSDAGNFDRARPQFETMAAGDGEHVSFSRVTGSEEATLEVSLRDQIDHIVKYLSTGDFGAVMSESTGSDDVAGQAIAGAVRAALVD